MTTFELLTVFFGSSILLTIIKSIFNTGKIIQKIESIDQKLIETNKKMSSIEDNIKLIDGRLNRLEGAFFERGYWESRSYQISRNKNDGT